MTEHVHTDTVHTHDMYDHVKDKVFLPEHRLLETENFNVVADDNPLTEGHMLIIPKVHVPCVGNMSDTLVDEFKQLYDKMSGFVKETYGSVSTFEHGKVGQTIYHAHVHILPYEGTPESIVPEGSGHMKKTDSIKDVREAFHRDGQYLFMSIGEDKWLVDAALGYPRFFRDRFASALGAPKLGDWVRSGKNPRIKAENAVKISGLEQKWRSFAAK